MMPVYICEDEAPIRQFIRKQVENHILIAGLDMAVQCDTADPKHLLDACRAAPASGVYFLDIDLGRGAFNGFELAKEIRRHDAAGAIIFVTTHGELSMETFRYRLQALDYILKDDMDAAARRIGECLDSVQQRVAQRRREQSSYYTVKVFDTLHNVPVSSILYFETSHQKHRILLHAEDRILEFFGNLQTIEESLGANFFRCHRSCLVNREKIRAVHMKQDEVELVNGEKCPLSRKAKKQLQGEA